MLDKTQVGLQDETNSSHLLSSGMSMSFAVAGIPGARLRAWWPGRVPKPKRQWASWPTSSLLISEREKAWQVDIVCRVPIYRTSRGRARGSSRSQSMRRCHRGLRIPNADQIEPKVSVHSNLGRISFSNQRKNSTQYPNLLKQFPNNQTAPLAGAAFNLDIRQHLPMRAQILK